MELKGKIALVTGAGSGIGKAAALRLAAEGARVAALSRTAEEVEKTCAEIKAAGGQSIALMADTSDEAQMRGAVEQLTDTFNSLDIVVANAGINGVWAPIDDLKPEEWDKTIAVNLRGTYLTLHLTVPHLKRHGGSIIVVSSINGTRTFTTPAPPPTPQPRRARSPSSSSSPSNSADTASASMPSARARSRPISAPTPTAAIARRRRFRSSGRRGIFRLPAARQARARTSPKQSSSLHPTALDTSPVRRSGSTAARACCDSLAVRNSAV